VAENRFLHGFPGGMEATRGGMLETPCDVLVPAALECQITPETAARIDCGLIAEAARLRSVYP
jgi:glutamate dehydrogenase (NAD(P)+)